KHIIEKPLILCMLSIEFLFNNTSWNFRESSHRCRFDYLRFAFTRECYGSPIWNWQLWRGDLQSGTSYPRPLQQFFLKLKSTISAKRLYTTKTSRNTRPVSDQR